MRHSLAIASCLFVAVLVATSLILGRAAPPPSAPAGAAVHHSGADAARSAPSAATATDLSPSRLLIPGIEVDAAIEARGLDSSRNLATPIDFHDVAWFNQGPLPGQPGNALLNGHVDWWTGSAVFARLAELRPGDAVVVVRADGTRASFKVTGRRILAATARDATLFAPADAAKLTLITCSGWWDPLLGGTTERLLVSAALA